MLAPQLLARLELDLANLHTRVICMVDCHVSIVQMIRLQNKPTLAATCSTKPNQPNILLTQ